MKRLITTTILALLLAASVALAVDYPSQEGNVYDGAGMLTEQAEIALEQKLLDFETSTTIGIAVCTVESLQGIDSDTYARNVGNKWDIGSDVTDNGVILLLAKHERRLALWFGDGYKNSWAEPTSQYVRDRVMVPQLKAGRYDLAITKGVDEVIRQVTSGGYVNKWAVAGSVNTSADADVRAEPPPPNPDRHLEDVMQDKARREWSRNFLRTTGIGFTLLVLLIGVFRMRGIHARRRKLLGELDVQTEALTHKLEQLPALEERLRGGYPEAMWGPALSAINASAMERLMYTSSKGRDNAELEQQLAQLRMAVGSVERVEQVLRRAEHGRTDSARMLRELTPQLSALRTALQNPDVLPETSALLEPLEVRQGELTAMLPADAAAGSFDWAAFADNVDKLVADAAGLQARAESDVAQVREAREQMPQVYAQAQEKLAELRARNGGRYSDVDARLDEMEQQLAGYRDYGYGYNYGGMQSRDLMYMWAAMQNALQHAQVAETSYVTHTTPSSSGSGFSSGSGGSSSWGGGGGSSFGGGGSSGGGGGGSSSW
jgi:uncharacterized membrane protein YgcG